MSVLTTSRSFLTGHMSTTLVAVHMNHMDMGLFRGSGGYVLMSVSYMNPRSAGVSGGMSRWLSIHSAACVTDAPVGMCVEDSVEACTIDWTGQPQNLS